MILLEHEVRHTDARSPHRPYDELRAWADIRRIAPLLAGFCILIALLIVAILRP